MPEIDFQSHKIKTATLASGQGYVVLRSLCEAFGLDRSAQQRRLSRTAIFREHSLICLITTSQGKVPQTSLSAFAVPAFLMGVETSRIANEETQKLLEAFQEEGMIGSGRTLWLIRAGRNSVPARVRVPHGRRTGIV